MRRTFIAVDVIPAPGLCQVISIMKKDLAGENIRWTDPGSLHLTLAFIGETEESEIKDICSVMKKMDPAPAPVIFSVAGLGVFPESGDPRVIWAGITNPDALISLQRKISEVLHPLKVISDKRIFKPHLTLGRVKHLRNPAALRGLISKFSTAEFQTAEVSEAVYYESILRAEGPLYKPIVKVRL